MLNICMRGLYKRIYGSVLHGLQLTVRDSHCYGRKASCLQPYHKPPSCTDLEVPQENHLSNCKDGIMKLFISRLASRCYQPGSFVDVFITAVSTRAECDVDRRFILAQLTAGDRLIEVELFAALETINSVTDAAASDDQYQYYCC
jgi:hypothetical protein